MDILTLTADDLEGFLRLLPDNSVAFGVICSWVLYDPANRKGRLAKLLNSYVVIELLTPEALEAVVDIGQDGGLETEPVIMEALAAAQHYDLLPLRSKINHWDSQQVLHSTFLLESHMELSLVTLFFNFLNFYFRSRYFSFDIFLLKKASV